MKYIFATLLLFISFSTFAQQTDIKAVLKDANTKEPIIGASISIKNLSIGTITNDEGVFQLTFPKSEQIIISCLGYKTLTLNTDAFLNETKTIFMEQNIEILEEVVISKTPLHQILEEIIAISKARFNKPIVLNTYYREFVKSNGKYVRFSDGLLDYHISGDIKKTKSELIIKQNRSVLLPILEDDEDVFDLGSILDIQKCYGYSFGSLSGYILEDKQYQDYELGLKSKKNKDGKELLVLTIEPKLEIEKALFKGKITYDPDTKLIYDYDISYSPSHAKYVKEINLLIARVSLSDIKLKATYKMVNDNYLISNTNRFVKFKVWTKKHSTILESRSDLLVTDFSKDDFSYNKKEVYKKSKLSKKPSQYSDKFWQKNNTIVLTTEEEKIIDDLEKESKIEPKQN
jgi:hypothetical protein